jgi:serine protease inhibitor
MKINMKLRRTLILLLSMILLFTIALNITACSAAVPQTAADDLMEEVKPAAIDGKEANNQFIGNTADFSLELFKKSINNKKNSLVSPISVMFALGMTANGADGETLTQMEEVLGKDISLNDLNEYLYSYAKSLPNEEKSKLEIANSIWFRDDENHLTIEEDFLQKNADYYNSEIYKVPFSDQTLMDINNWVKKNTDGMIGEILDEIRDDAVMYLINAIVFDAEWENVYNKDDIYQDEFTSIDGVKQMTDFMRSEESLFLDDGSATGFIKPYSGGKYSFAALLPNEGVAIEEYILNLSGKDLLNTINNAEAAAVNATIPKFSYEFEVKLNDVLIDMGISDGFHPQRANFKRMGTSSMGNIFIGEVLHKTFISLDELGTKAGAVTKVEMKAESAAANLKIVNLDRPFVYAIIDNSTQLPVFIGTVMNPKE